MTQIGEYEASLRANYAAVKARLGMHVPTPRVRLERELRRLEPIVPLEETWPDTPGEVQGPPHLVNDPTHARLPPVPLWKRIVREVSDKHRVTFAEIVGESRRNRVVVARHEACYRMAKETTLSLAGIGRRINKDHTTVIYAVEAHQRRAMEAA